MVLLIDKTLQGILQVIYRGYMGLYRGYIGVILGLHRSYIGVM